MENLEDTTKSPEVTQSFGVNRWQEKKTRYEMEDFIVSPPSQEEGGFFQVRYGRHGISQSSTQNQNTQGITQDNTGTTAGSGRTYIGLNNQNPGLGNVGGTISMDAAGSMSFDDFSQQPDHPSKISYSTMPDLTLDAHLFPHVDQRMTLPWGNHSLPKESPALKFAQNYHGGEGKIFQSVKHFNIAEKEVTYADMTTQGSESITLNTTYPTNYQQVKEQSSTRVRKRSGLEQYVGSLANQTHTSYHHMDENRDGEDEEVNSRKSSLNNQSCLHNNLNLRTSEDSNNDYLYEPYSPLVQLDSEAINDIQNNDKQCTSVNEKNGASPKVSRELKSQDSVDDTEVKGRQRKVSLLHLVNPFIPFQDSMAETEHPMPPKEEIREKINNSNTERKKSSTDRHEERKILNSSELEQQQGAMSSFFSSEKRKISNSSEPEQLKGPVSRFFCTEGYDERKKSGSSEPDELSHNFEQLKNISSMSNDLPSSGKHKVKKHRPKPSALREMNIWGPSSM